MIIMLQMFLISHDPVQQSNPWCITISINPRFHVRINRIMVMMGFLMNPPQLRPKKGQSAKFCQGMIFCKIGVEDAKPTNGKPVIIFLRDSTPAIPGTGVMRVKSPSLENEFTVIVNKKKIKMPPGMEHVVSPIPPSVYWLHEHPAKVILHPKMPEPDDILTE